MKKISIWAAALVAASLLSAFGMAHSRAAVFEIDSAPYFDGTEYVGPYNSRLDGGPLTSFCIDLNSTVGFGQQFDVTVINLANFQGPAEQATIYREEGWLAEQTLTLTDTHQISIIQRAIWVLGSDGGILTPYLNRPDVFVWVNAAEEHAKDFALDSGITLYLKDGFGQSQMSVVPEPATYAIFGAGLISLVGFRRLFRNRAS